MSKKIADDLGIDYCGVQYGRDGAPVCALYNDTYGCGGSFSVPATHDVLDVALALDEKRLDFERGYANV